MLPLGLEAPGGDRTRWAFATPAQPSRLVLPVVRGAEPPLVTPPCPGLRGQPCRTYVPAGNGG